MAYSQYRNENKGFSGIVKESFKGKEQSTSGFVEGKTVFKTGKGGGYSFVAPGQTAIIETPQERLTITPTQLTRETKAQEVSIQRQNVLQEARNRQAEQSYSLKVSKQQSLVTTQTPISRGFPIGTREEEARLRAREVSLFGVDRPTSAASLIGSVDTASLASDVIIGYKPSKFKSESEGTFISNQRLFQRVGIAKNVLSSVQRDIDKGQLAFEDSSKAADILYQGEIAKQKDVLTTKTARGYDIIQSFKPVIQFPQTALLSGFSGRLRSVEEAGAFKTQRVIGVRGFEDQSLIPLGTTGKAAQLGLVAIGGSLSATQFGKTYLSQRGLGLSKGQALNIAGGQALEGLSPIQFKKSTILSVKNTPQIQTSSSELSTLKLGTITTKGGDYSITTSRGRSGTLGLTQVKIFTQTPTKLFPSNRDPLGTIKTFEIPTYSNVKLLPSNIALTKQTGKDTFTAAIEGRRTTTQFTKQLIAKGQYDFALEPRLIKTSESFKGFGQAKIIKQDDSGLIKLGLSKGQVNILSPSAKKTYSFDNLGNLKSLDLTRGGLKAGRGRPTIARGFEIFKETSKITTPDGSLTGGKLSSIIRSRGRTNVLGFKTKFYEPSSDLISIGDATTRGFTSFKGRGRSNLGTISSKDIKLNIATKSLTQSLSSKALSTTLPKGSIKTITRSSGLGISQASFTSQALSYGLTSSLKQLGSLKQISGLQLGSRLTPRQTQSFSFVYKDKFATPFAPRYSSDFAFTPSLTLPPSSPITFAPPVTPPVFPVGGLGGFSLNGETLIKPRSIGRRTGSFRIGPSFTGLQLGSIIKSPLKVSKTFGVTPFQRRGILKGKGDYFKLVDF